MYAEQAKRQGPAVSASIFLLRRLTMFWICVEGCIVARYDCLTASTAQNWEHLCHMVSPTSFLNSISEALCHTGSEVVFRKLEEEACVVHLVFLIYVALAVVLSSSTNSASHHINTRRLVSVVIKKYIYQFGGSQSNLDTDMQADKQANRSVKQHTGKKHSGTPTCHHPTRASRSQTNNQQ